MTDLATRIADLKQKAEAAKEAEAEIALATEGRIAFDDTDMDRWAQIISEFHYTAASPDLFLAMAARIEELEKALEPFAAEADLIADEMPDHMQMVELPYCTVLAGDLRAAARAVSTGEKP